jgi:predicted RNA-binding Zn-ribbon protein involved in translation (DUF1610 family)
MQASSSEENGSFTFPDCGSVIIDCGSVIIDCGSVIIG